jgi:hypothetical protein
MKLRHFNSKYSRGILTERDTNILKALKIISLIIVLSSCESKERYYRPDLPEKLCTIGIIDADDTISQTPGNPYSFNDYLRYISFEKSYQSEYPGEVSDSLRNFSFSISSSAGELFSYQNDSTLKNPESFKLPVSLQFASGEKYFLQASTEGLQAISAETIVPEPPASIILNSIHKETEPAIPPPGCYWPAANHDSVKYAVMDISFDVTRDSYYAILVEGVGMDASFIYNAAFGYVDFSVRNSNVRGFNAILYGPKVSHCNCEGEQWSRYQSSLRAFFIDSNNIPGDQCNLTLSVKFNDFYSIFVFFTSFRIKLLSVPREFYLFEKNLYTYEKVIEDPFSEPVYLSGNIKDGNGIFAICRSTELNIMLPFPYK